MSETISVSDQLEADQKWVETAFFNASSDIIGASGLNSIVDRIPNFYDTSLGGNRSINSEYQFSPTTDPRGPSMIAGSEGMGNYYLEAIDSNATRITLSFGVPEYNSLARYLANYYDNDIATYTTDGRMTSDLFSAFNVGYATGFILTLPFQAVVGIINLAQKAISFITKTPYSKFYYFKPTMGAYWTAVSYLVNKVAIDLDLQLGFSTEDYEEVADTREGATGTKVQPKQDAASLAKYNKSVAAMNALMPDVFKRDVGQTIDVMAVAGKSQRLADQYNRKLSALIEASVDFDSYVTALSIAQANMKLTGIGLSNTEVSTYDTIKRHQESLMGASATTEEVLPTEEVTDGDIAEPDAAALDSAVAASAIANVLTTKENESTFSDYMVAAFKEGSAFVNFAVDYNGAVTESFSNSTKPLQLKEQMAGLAGTTRDFAVNTGNLFDLGGIMGGVTDFLKGTAASVGLGSLASLGKGAFPDMQDTWDNSTAEFGSESYTMKLKCPYPDAVTYLQDIIVPMCCVLGGGLPRTSGKNSYVSPFLCQMDSIGRTKVSTGMIDSITVTRGGGSVGWSKDNLPTEVIVTFNIKNLDTIMHVPVADSLLSTATGFSLFDEENALSDYSAVLSGLSKYNTFYLTPRWKRATGLWSYAASTLTSKSYIAQKLRYSLPGGLVSAFMSAATRLKDL